MKKRWLIRSIFIAPVLLFMLLWLLSGVRSIFIYYSATNHMATLFLAQGVTGLEYFNDIQVPPSFSGWQFENETPSHVRFFPRDDSAYDYHLGFAFGRKSAGNGGAVPLWVLTLLSIAILWPVWRKTRGTRVAGAFPVEPVRSPTKSE